MNRIHTIRGRITGRTSLENTTDTLYDNTGGARGSRGKENGAGEIRVSRRENSMVREKGDTETVHSIRTLDIDAYTKLSRRASRSGPRLVKRRMVSSNRGDSRVGYRRKIIQVQHTS